MLEELQERLDQHLLDKIVTSKADLGELTLEISKENLLSVVKLLRDHDDFQFQQLIDLCAVDYLVYGKDEWTTQSASSSGFERGRQNIEKTCDPERRFAVVYHLLSITLNQRLRLRVFVEQETLMIPSVVEIWNGANWFEREAFDLYGILFEGHPDLRRILTDYGFIGHPFRKDFSVIGELEMIYDEQEEQCVYQPVSIEERILVPKVIRKDTSRAEK